MIDKKHWNKPGTCPHCKHAIQTFDTGYVCGDAPRKFKCDAMGYAITVTEDVNHSCGKFEDKSNE